MCWKKPHRHARRQMMSAVQRITVVTQRGTTASAYQRVDLRYSLRWRLILAMYTDSLVNTVQSCVACYTKYTSVSISLYALLIAHTVSSWQLLLSMCEEELESLDILCRLV